MFTRGAKKCKMCVCKYNSHQLLLYLNKSWISPIVLKGIKNQICKLGIYYLWAWKMTEQLSPCSKHTAGKCNHTASLFGLYRRRKQDSMRAIHNALKSFYPCQGASLAADLCCCEQNKRKRIFITFSGNVDNRSEQMIQSRSCSFNCWSPEIKAEGLFS